jgi:hypothetical protein
MRERVRLKGGSFEEILEKKGGGGIKPQREIRCKTRFLKT